MSFDILFSRYCSLLENRKQKMPFRAKLAFVCFILLLFTINALFLIFIFTTNWLYLIGFFGLLALFLVFLFLTPKKNKKSEVIFDEQLKEAETYTNEVISLLDSVGIDHKNKAVLDLLINKAKDKQKDNFTIGFTKSAAMLSSLYYLIVTLVCKALYDKYGFWKLIVFLIFSVLFFFVISVFFQYVKAFAKRYIEFKHTKYSKFIEDLTQIEIFYA